MIRRAEAVNLAKNMEEEPKHEASVDDRGDATEGGVSLSAPAEEEKEGRNGDHSQQSQERSSKESSVKEELSQTNRRE